MKNHALLSIGLACALGATPMFAEENPAPTYAVMSLIGDSITVNPSWGVLASERSRITPHLNIDRRIYDVVEVPRAADVFDDVVAASVMAAVKKQQGNAEFDVLQTSNSGLYSLQDDIFGHSEQAAAARNGLKAMLGERKDRYLILITKHRNRRAEELGIDDALADAHVEIVRGSSLPTVRREGLGLYMAHARFRYVETGQYLSWGLMAYVDATVRLIDAQSMQVLAEVPAARTEFVAFKIPLEPIYHVWEETPQSQKTTMLRYAIAQSMEKAVPRLWVPPGQ
jgi:hypothetical protein